MQDTHPIYVDICWTLYRSNTTFDFLDNIISNKLYRLLRTFCKTTVGYWGNILLYRLTHIDWQRRLAVQYLKGMSQVALEARAQTFIATLEQTKRIDTSFNILAQTQAPVIILSDAAIGQMMGAVELPAPIKHDIASQRRWGIGFMHRQYILLLWSIAMAFVPAN